MRIAIYNLEPKYKNFALEKVRLFYSLKGVEVEDYFALDNYDEVWCSSIFDYTNKNKVPQNAITGGTGFDIKNKLPCEIDSIKPHLNFGFTTRGCIRKCPFCVVPEKEGHIRIEGELYDLWDGKSKDIVLYDNNILALPEHFLRICEQANRAKIRLDFNQGLDHRLLTQDIIDLIKSIHHKELRFAFDDIRYLSSVEKAINLLQKNGIKRCLWYVLVGFNSSFEDDLNRLNYLRSRNQSAFVQRYNHKSDKKLIALSRWANQHHIFQGMTWQQFLNHPNNKSYLGLLR